MSISAVFAVGVEVHLDPAIPPARHVAADANAFAESLSVLGVSTERQTILLNAAATKTVLESRLRRFRPQLRRDDTIAVYVAGLTFAADGANYIVAHDTQADDLDATAVPLRAVVESLAGSAGRVVFFLDSRPLPEPPSAVTDLDESELQDLFAESRRVAAFVSRGPGEESHASDALKHGVWAHLLLQALAGEAPAALDDDRLTPRSLQRHLADELPRTLRRVLERPAVQTPVLIGRPPASWSLADFGPLFRSRRGLWAAEGQRLENVSLRSETRQRVKELAGFQKTHAVPDRVRPATERFVAAIARDDLQADLDAVYAAVREHLDYKRKDVTVTPATEGAGSLRTPAFDYRVTVALAGDDPSRVVWRREVTNLRHPDVLHRREFQRAFGNAFQVLSFEYAKPLDVAGLVDRFEEAPAAGLRVHCAADGSWCEVELAGFPGTLRVEGNRLDILARRIAGAGSLWAAFEAFQQMFNRAASVPRLTAAGG
jgi:hypothetical protein